MRVISPLLLGFKSSLPRFWTGNQFKTRQPYEPNKSDYKQGEGFAEALALLGEKSECKRPMATVVSFSQSLLSPILRQCIIF